MKRPILFPCKRSTSIGAIAAALILSCLCGCGSVSPQGLVAGSIQKHLPTLIGPAENYRVSVDGDPFALSRGSARKVTIEGTEVQVSPSLTLDGIAIESHNLRYDKSLHKIVHADDTQVTASIGAVNLTRYLATTHAPWCNLQVQFTGDRANAELPLTILNQSVDARFTGHLSPDSSNPAGIDLVADSANLAGIPAPASLVNLALQRVNPLVDLSRFRYPVQITSCAVESQRLVVSGKVEIAP